MIDYSKVNKVRTGAGEESQMNELDRLFKSVKEYRSSKHFSEMLDFCSRFKHLAPFNAMMIEMQRPSSRYVLTADEWEKLYDRRIKPNARPLVILNHTPVSYVFEVGDTEPNGDLFTKDEEILESITHQYDTRQEVSKEDLDMLINNLQYAGIDYTDKFVAGADYGAQLRRLDYPNEISIYLGKKRGYIRHKAYFLISVNKNLTIGARYASILHELGHYFCQHLKSPQGGSWWITRDLGDNIEEFEAESVAHLTCNRLNIERGSEKYLSHFLNDEQEIPEGISVGAIFKAHNRIWELLFSKPSNIKKTWLYKYDSEFASIVDSTVKKTPKQLTLDFAD